MTEDGATALQEIKIAIAGLRRDVENDRNNVMAAIERICNKLDSYVQDHRDDFRAAQDKFIEIDRALRGYSSDNPGLFARVHAIEKFCAKIRWLNSIFVSAFLVALVGAVVSYFISGAEK